MLRLNIKDTFNKELPADPIRENTRRQVENANFSFVAPKTPKNPTLVHVSEEVLADIGLTPADAQTKDFLDLVTGAKVQEGTDPYAMVYGGHQFGNWAGQLGDGRAINLFEVVNDEGARHTLQLKGAGETPYSRSADGLAVLRSSIREHLCSEAMYHLGVPTTRSLSLSLSGDRVLRDVLYNGNSAYEKGAIVCRVAPSFIRFGNFQILAARQDKETLQKLTDYTIKHFYPEITEDGSEKYVKFFEAVVNRTVDMVVEWQRVGFVHGVMNTDNMSILGLTIDYGPYGWLEPYDQGWTPNTTDSSQRRYRYGYQPQIALWNLLQLGNALYPLVGDAKPFEAALDSYKKQFDAKYHKMMGEKIGLASINGEKDMKLISDLEEILQVIETDMTIFFRELAKFDPKIFSAEDILNHEQMKSAFYEPEKLEGDIKDHWLRWFESYIERSKEETLTRDQRKELMDGVNPKYVLRNYMAQLAIDAADNGDYSVIDELYKVLKNPYAEQLESEQWYAKRPDWAKHKVGCSMLSCSS